MKSVRDIPVFENIPIMVRAALNEPVENGVVTNTFRVSQACATLKFLQQHRARVIVVSHIGEQGTETLEPVAKVLATMLPQVTFFPETIGPKVRDAIRKMMPGDILVLENLRRNRGEVMNDPEFAKELAALADVFVEDSFDTCHRTHASIVGVPKILPSYAGLIVEAEVRELTAALTPLSPSLAVIGGAKFATKEPILEKLLATYDKVFVGGALANDFLLAQGREVGKSLVSNADPVAIKKLMENPKLIIPIDTVEEDEKILDIGPGSIALLAHLVAGSKQVLWNGPLGNYENGFSGGTNALAQTIADSGAYSVVGGGDTVAAIQSLNVLERISFVSTGGGAMIEFLAKGTLPGIQALG